MILVVGATAHFGRQTVERLAAAGEPVRALTRSPESAGLPAGVEVARGDLTKAETLPAALDGVSAVFLVLPYKMDAGALIEAAREAGVRRIVFLSSGAVVDGVDRQPDVIAEYHAEVEKAIEASGIDWTFLRIFFPAINSLAWGMQLQQGDVIRAPYAGAASAPVHEQDVAEMAVRALTAPGHAGKVYEPTGAESLTQVEQVRILGEALGRPLSYEELDPEPVKQTMGQFMEPAFVTALFDLMAATVGKPAPVSSIVEEITGHRPRTYAQWAADHVTDFG